MIIILLYLSFQSIEQIHLLETSLGLVFIIAGMWFIHMIISIINTLGYIFTNKIVLNDEEFDIETGFGLFIIISGFILLYSQ